MTATLADQVRASAAIPVELDRCISLIHAGDYPGAAILMQSIMAAPGAGPLEWYWAGALLHGMRDYKGACAFFSSVLDHAPDLKPARYNRGVSWECLGRSEAAIADYRRLVDWPDSWPEGDHNTIAPLVNMGGALYRIGKPEEGYKAHSRALAADAQDDDEAIVARSAVKLLRGDYVGGFRDYERRRWLGQFRAMNWEPRWGKRWDGGPTKGPVCLFHEQGSGDTIQMLRYAPLVAERSGHYPALCVQPELKELVRWSFPDSEVLTREELAQWTPRPRWHAPLMSLPYYCGTTVETVPPSPYLTLKPEAQRTTVRTDQRFTVGLCWKGNPQHQNDRDRSMPTVETLRPVLDLKGVRFQSLQHGTMAPDGVEPLRAANFMETAEVVAACDLVISVDTSVVHLAGALGVPTILFAPTAPEWRWGLSDSTPWYGAMHIVRRQSTKDWAPKVALVADIVSRYV